MRFYLDYAILPLSEGCEIIYNIRKVKINSEDYKDKLKHLPLLEVLKEIKNLSGCTLKESKELIDKIKLEIYTEKDSTEKNIQLELIDNIPQCDVGAPLPIIFSDERFVYLFYYLRKDDKNWDGTYVNIRNSDVDEGVACIKFKGLTQYKFGAPNDEAIEGHPMYKYGLEAYSFFEVKNSEWIKTLMQMNRVHPCHKDKYFDNCRHFIYFFHDNCFEIVCDSYSYEIINTSIKEALINMIKRK
ncbi:MAG: hypothetical protein LBK69_00830 [Syntrophomonadaceae bacterium]|nr:hypothetical protein [Syntrophomonadaceae bacterium]